MKVKKYELSFATQANLSIECGIEVFFLNFKLLEFLVHFFRDYLHNRKQRVILPGANSDWTSVNSGVPQGSIIGPLLFLLYINDIVEDINSSIRLFADDTSLYIIVDNPVEAANQLNSDLSKIHQMGNKMACQIEPSEI